MKTLIGIGLIATFGLVACAPSSDGAVGAIGSGGEDDGDVRSDRDPTDPAPAVDADDPETPATAVVSGLSISEIAFFQGVKVTAAKGGKWIASRNAPIVAHRPALVRVYVEPKSSWRGGKVTGELRLVGGSDKTPVLRDTKTITTASTDENPRSTFNFELPAEAITGDATFQIALTSPDAVPVEEPSDALFPRDGSYQRLGAERAGKLRIVVVPVKYDADGSGRTPDVSAAQLERYQKTFMARYPASTVELSARAPFPWQSSIARNGAGFSQILQAITQLRRADGVASDVYYYGLLAPDVSMSQFCRGGCVTGLSSVVNNPSTAFLRVSVGLGFSGQDAANTMAHEVGHAHAPCGGAQSVDRNFPYSTGSIGVWGYDILGKVFIDPTRGRDMMGYCPNEWVSDYTFEALFNRISAVNQLASGVRARSTGSGAGTYRMATVAADGTMEWTGEIELDEAPTGGEPRTATFAGPNGARLGSRVVQFYPFDHLPGGFLVVPANGAGAPTWSSVHVSGLRTPLSR